jgi:outer membrane protein TolC
MEISKSTNVSLLQQDKNLLINEYDIKVAKSGYLPKIGLRGSYGWNYAQSAPSAFFPSINNSNLDLGLSVNLTWNIFDGGTSSVRIKNAKIALNNQEILKQQLELQIERDLMNALEIYQNRQVVFSIQEKNVETNQNNFDRSKEQFSLGSISSISFRQAQINLMNAQTNKNKAKYDAKLAELQLIQLTGPTPQRGILKTFYKE